MLRRPPPPGAGSPLASRASRNREYLARRSWRAPPPLPLPRIAIGDLLEAHPVMPGRPRDVQMNVDARRGAEPDMPAGRRHGAAPLGELRMPQDPGGIADERKVVHQDRRKARIPCPEPALGR